jgi:rod shape-determining protein MreC
MERLLNQYRNFTVLVVAILAQLGLLAYQIKSNQDVRLIRVWAVGAVTPMARLLEGVRSGSSHFFGEYFSLRGVRDENHRLKTELDKAKLENQFLRTELNTADRAKTLAIFQSSSQSKTVGARVIGNSTGFSGKVVFVDRGTSDGIERGMAVITPDGIVGKIISVYSSASQVLLITDPSFAAGVVSQKNRTYGTLKGQGHNSVSIDYIQNEKPLEQGEWFYTAGDDRIFPKGLRVGIADIVRAGPSKKEVSVTPSGLQDGLEEVLIIIEGVHGKVPDVAPQNQDVHLMVPAPPDGTADLDPAPSQSGSRGTEADHVMDRYRNRVFGALGGTAPGDKQPHSQ